MVSETRSSRKKDEVDDNTVKKQLRHAEGSSSKCNLREAHVLGVIKSSRETSSAIQMTSSPKSNQKSKRHVNPISPSTPTSMRKSERLEKQNMLSPARGSGGEKKNMSSSSSSKQYATELTLSNLWRKERKEMKEKNLITLESKKAELGLESVGVNLKRMDARSFKALFKSQRIKIVLPDPAEAECLTCLEGLLDCAIRSESGNKDIQTKETTTSPSAKSENPSLLGTCVLCYKKRRGDLGDVVHLETSDSRNSCEGTNSKRQMDGHENTCVICGKDGELLCCVGKDCKRCYHHYCLDPPLTDALPGVWHCLQCVNKKFMSGVHSVSLGVESIWDVREVDVSNATGMHRQKQFFVKYHGLAHVHNNWVSENQLCLENLRLISNFLAKDKIVMWSSEWTVPHRLLRKRPVHKLIIKCSVDVPECHYEWLVKWHGLNYDHATWELESAYFLSSALGQKLKKDYESRLERAKNLNKHGERSLDIVSELPSSGSQVNNSKLLKNVNKLHKCWFKCRNVAVFNNQEQVMSVIFFIQSMKDSCQPFLVVASSETISSWEAEFVRLAPAVDVVVYGGNREIRKGIRASEFYGDHLMIQVLLSSSQAFLEDLDALRCIKWGAVVVDDYQHSGLSNTLKAIMTLTTYSRIVLVDDTKEGPQFKHINILALLDSLGGFEKLGCLNTEQTDKLDELEKSSHVNFESSSEVSKFLEYWVPVQISNYQLELYCDALFNCNALRSCSRSDSFGALRDILLSVQKCCDHPYLVDASIQKALFAEQHPVSEILDIGIKASGKLHLLDLMLAEIKTRELKVLILYQTVVGTEGASIGDILDDFMRQRFGENTYERVDSRVINSKKQASVCRFNKETGKFVFLLENRACSSSIKLSSLDLIIMYDSDWNPANDFRALQKISIDSKVKQIKVFRLYSSCTVEERELVLAKQNLSRSRSRVDALLMWGASYLFRKLDEYHNECNSAGLKIASEQLLFNEVSKEFQAIISENCVNIDSNALISKVTLDIGSYKTNIPLLGEKKIQFIDGVKPHMFWRNLLDRGRPKWKHLRDPCPRNRKRAQCLEGSPRILGSENGYTSKKCKISVNDDVDPASIQVDFIQHQVTQIASSNEGPPKTIAGNQSESLHRDRATTNSNPNYVLGQSSSVVGVDTFESEERFLLFHEQKSLHSVLKKEVTRLCQVLNFSDAAVQTARRFLEYVINNHDVSSVSPAITHAFQISLCWIAALISKQKFDKKHSVILARQLLNYQCTEDQVNSVYLKMQSLKWMYSQCSENNNNSVKGCLLADEELHNVSKGVPLFPPFKLKNVKIEIEEKLANEDCAEAQIPLLQKLELMAESAGSEIQDKMKKIKKKVVNRMKKLIRKQQEEVLELQRNWEEERLKLEADHKLKSAVTRSIHGEGSVRICKLKILEDGFEMKMAEHNLLKDTQLKDLEVKHVAARKEESQKIFDWVAETITCSSELMDTNGPQPLGYQSENDAACSQLIAQTSPVSLPNVFPMSQQQLQEQNSRKSVCTQGNDAGPSDRSTSTPSDVLACNYPAETPNNLESVISSSETWAMPSERTQPTAVEQLNQLIDSSDVLSKLGSTSLPDSGEQVSDEIRAVVLNKDASTEVFRTVPSKTASQVVPMVLSGVSNPRDLTGLSNSQENQSNELDESSNTGSLFPVSAVSLSCNQSQVSERNEDQGRTSSQTTKAGETEEFFQEFVSQSTEASQLLDDHVDLGPVSGVDHEQSLELFIDSPNNMPVSEAMISASELPVQLGIDAPPLHVPRPPLVHPVHQISQWNSTPSLLAEPLQSELERLDKEAEQLEKTREDLMSQIRSDCEKEIQEIITQVRAKYDVKIKDAEAEFTLKKNEVDKNQNKVLMNKSLAEAFRFKCSKLKPSWRPGMQLAFPSSFVQHLHHISIPSAMRPSGASACQPFLNQQTTNPNVQATNHLSLPSSMRYSHFSSVIAPPPSQALELPSPLFSGSSSRPPAIDAFTSAANPRVGGDIRSRAPHLQPFRPAAPCVGWEIRAPAPHLQSCRPSMDVVASTSQHHPRQMLQTPPSPQLMTSNVLSQNIPEHQRGIPNPLNSHLSAADLLRKMNPSIPMNPSLSPLPDVDTTFASLDPSDFDTLCDVHSNPETSTALDDILLI